MTPLIDATREAFLADVIAHPDDDFVRLVFADWLEEHGEAERAEFIRVQCELARSEKGHTGFHKDDGSPYSCRVCTTRRRAKVLFDGLPPDESPPRYTGNPWVEALDDSDDLEMHPRLIYRRGFVHSVTLPAADWLAHADALLRAHPIREVRLTTWPGLGYNSVLNGQPVAVWVMQPEWNEGWTPGDDTGHPGEVDILSNREPLVRRFIEPRWPRITFALPPAGENVPQSFWDQMTPNPTP